MNLVDSSEMFNCSNSSSSSELLSASKVSPTAAIIDKERLLDKEQRRNIIQQDTRALPVFFSGRSYVKSVTLKKVKSIYDCENIEKSEPLEMSQNQNISNSSSSDANSEIKEELGIELSNGTASRGTEANVDNKTEVHDFVKAIEAQFDMCGKVMPTKRLKVCESYSKAVSSPCSSADESGTTWHSCDKCHLEFNSRKSLANHVKTHPKVMVVKNTCVYCGMKTDDPKGLSDHLLTEHLYDVANFTCESCHVECISADLFDKHQYACHRNEGTNSLICSICDKVYYDNDIFEYHKRQQKQCHICCLTFCMASHQFKTHKEKHTLFKYSCDHCSSSFVTKGSLTRHLEMENGCASKYDNKSVSTSAGFEDVSENVADNVTCKSRGCDSTESAEQEPNDAVNENGEKEKCRLCPAEFAYVKNLWKHVAVVHQEDIQGVDVQHLPAIKSHPCVVCDKKFTRSSSLVAHMASHIDKTYSEKNGKPQCTICHKTFQAKRYLVDHMRLHSDNQTYACQCCDRKFLRKSHLKLHMEKHNNIVKSYSCPHCEKCYMKKKDQVQHIRQKHNTPSAPNTGKDSVIVEGFPCPTCSKRFATALKLRMHEISHTVSKPPYTCLECSRSFPSLNTLKRHYLVHWDVRPFTCSVCNRAFRHGQSLKRHMTTHTGEKPHSCKHCGKAFSLKGTLNCHMLIHSNQRTFTCYKCDGEFVSKRKMKFHTCCVPGQEESIPEEAVSVNENQSYTTFASIEDHSGVSDGNVNNSVSHITCINNTIVSSIGQVTHLISDQGTVSPMPNLVSEAMTNNLISVSKIGCSEMVPMSETVDAASITEISENHSSANISVNDKETEVIDVYQETSSSHTSHLSNFQQSDALSQAFAVMGDDLIQECVNLNGCSVLEAKPGIGIGPETTVYTFVRVDGVDREDPRQTLINIPAVTDTGTEENVTLQINLTDDCSEVFIIES